MDDSARPGATRGSGIWSDKDRTASLAPVNQPEPSDHDNVERLVAAGFSAQDIGDIADAAAWTYDVNRKPKGKKDGAIGATGVQIFRTLCTKPDYEPDLRAFAEHRPYTADAVADRIAMSRGAVGPAVNRLIEHGFVDRRRNGRQFDIRLAIPSVALTELGERWLAEDAGPGTYAGEVQPAFGARILVIWPRVTASSGRPE